MSDFAGQLTDAVTTLSGLRQAAESEAPPRVRSFVVEAIERAQYELANASLMATSGRPPSPLVIAIEKAERDGRDEDAKALLEQVRDDAAVIVGDGFVVVPAAARNA